MNLPETDLPETDLPETDLSDSIYASSCDTDPYESSETLINFLKNLVTSIENKQLYSSQLKEITDFFLAYQFHTQAIKDNTQNTNQDIDNQSNNQSNNETNNTQNNQQTLPNFSNQDLIKFLCLGWYIYTCILQEKNI